MKIAKQSVELIDVMGDDLSVVNAARVSFAKESDWEYDKDNHDGHGPERLSDKDAKLIGYLARHNHWTPFAHAFASFRIKAPIFVARQLVKHQVGLAWNEVSRRYVDDEPEFWFPKEWRGKPENAKQGSSNYTFKEDLDDLWIPCADGYLLQDHKDITQTCLAWYLNAIRLGVAPEQARMMLPLNTMTEWIWSGSLAAFARVCKLRLDAHAQQETQVVAAEIKQLLEPLFPVAFKALLDVSE